MGESHTSFLSSLSLSFLWGRGIFKTGLLFVALAVRVLAL